MELSSEDLSPGEGREDFGIVSVIKFQDFTTLELIWVQQFDQDHGQSRVEFLVQFPTNFYVILEQISNQVKLSWQEKSWKLIYMPCNLL